jgi:hypothetical protein
MENLPAATETKSADIADAFDEFKRLFEQYKEENNARIVEIERRAADPVTEEKVMKIGMALDANKRALDELVLQARLPALGALAEVAQIIFQQAVGGDECQIQDVCAQKKKTAGYDDLRSRFCIGKRAQSRKH